MTSPAMCEFFAKTQLVKVRYPDFMDSDDPKTKWRLRSNAQRTMGYAFFSGAFTLGFLVQPINYILAPIAFIGVGIASWFGLRWYFIKIDNEPEPPQKPWDY